ncbi:MAG: AraC family transcriptional regulator [Spirochaetes bacterium]|nr:AraC family transcriptional regulator [Spirochaetota bacterium]
MSRASGPFPPTGEVFSIGPRTRERRAADAEHPALHRAGIRMAGISRAHRGFAFARLAWESHQILFALAGSGKVWIDGRARALGPGSLYLTPAGVPHAYAADGNWQVAWAILSPDGWGEFPTELGVRGGMPSGFAHAIEGLLENPGKSQANLAWTEVLRLEILALLRPARAPSRLGPLWATVGEHLEKPWTLGDLAVQSGLDGETLRRHCLRETGRSPMAYVARLRMVRAVEWLARGLPVREAARLVGYANPFAFSVAFKRNLGSSPSAFLSRAAEGGRTR